MYKKSPQGWLKHWDFILLDIFCLQLAFVVAYLVRQGLENPYSDQIYRTVAFVFMLCQIVVMFLGQSYQDILKRGYYIEFTKTAKHVLMVMLLFVLYLFATQQAVSYSRLTLFYTAFLYLCFDYVGRVWHKENVLKKNATKKKEKSMVVVVSLAEAKETIEKILSGPIQNFSINGLALIDDNPGVKEIAGIPVVGNMDTISEYLCHEWVDEVFVKISETEPYPQKLIDEIITMGLTVHLSLGEMEKSLSGKNFIEKIGGYSVITSSINTASPKQLLYKRLMDIAGGIVGCLLTVILIIVIGPMIYIKSPGPIFFSQVRIGKNGKKFKIYKFRSMYMDAEERKAELMSQNKMEGLMFKMDYDPRIIGSEKKDKNGNPKGIGNFIRKTSLDEFPQFWNVLKGDMSLVGTRPPTVDEWEKYELHHRSRMSIKPGITGMWQASGRSDITDFEEVVKLDQKSDVARIHALYEYGGLYFDTDVEVLKNFSELLKEQGAVLGTEDEKKTIGTGFMAFVPKHEICSKMLEYYKNNSFADQSSTMSNTQILAHLLRENYGVEPLEKIQKFNDVTVYPSRYFTAYNGVTGRTEIAKDTCCIADGVGNMAASCSLMQKYGYTTYFSKGSEKNIKITTVEDIEIFKALLSAKNDDWIKK